MVQKYLIASFILFGSLLFAQNFDSDKMDRFMQGLNDNNRAMGNLSLSKNGKEVYNNSIGFADLENKIEINKNTQFRIGSISKTFTAVLIFQLIEEGKLSLNTKLSEYFPEIKNASKITIRNLLNHSSGLYNFTRSTDYAQWSLKEQNRENLLKIINEFAVEFEPFAKHEYSNTNYVLLSWILEDVYNKSFKEILKEKITVPLGLEFTNYGGKINTNQGKQANSYNWIGNWNKSTETDMSVPLGAGAIVSTSSDLNQFFHALFSYKLLKKETLDQMIFLKDGYGSGIFRNPFYDIFCYGHNGGIDGFTSTSCYFPEENVSYSFLSNGINYKLNDISLGVLSIFFKKDFEIPDLLVPEKIDLEVKEVKKFVGSYTSKEIPLDIEVFVEDDKLYAQATGQAKFLLTPISNHEFVFELAQIKMIFNKDKTMILEQGAGAYNYKLKEE